MMNLTYRYAANLGFAICALVAVSCNRSDDHEQRFVAQAIGSIPTSPPPSMSDACSGYRFVGLNPGSGYTCPAPPDSRWKPVNLFPASMAAELRSYCVYDWTGASAPRTDLLPGVSTPGDWLEPDCEILSTYGHPYAERNAQRFENAFKEQIEFVDIMPAAPGHETKVVVIDSSVNGTFPRGAPGRLPHGRDMATIIRGLACPGPGCAATVMTKLALPLVRSGSRMVEDRVTGGYLGRPSDIAAALHAGLHDALAAPGGNRIIFNMSLGWDGRWGGSTVGGLSAMPVSMQAVYSALKEAVCRGAIPIAAVGNGGGGPDASHTSVYPAAWESEPAPHPTDCAPFGPVAASTAPYQPLVYAAGGVDGADFHLSTGRRDARARIVAPADHSVMTDATYQTDVYTGTSVAAAATSAIAATVWTFMPMEDAHEVMAIVHGMGVSLNRTPNLCLTAPHCTVKVRRISMCRAMEHVCVANGCSVPACGPPNPGRNARASGLDMTYPLADYETQTGTTAADTEGACTGEVYVNDEEQVTNPCPGTQYYSGYTVPYSVPQPRPSVCPTCAMQINTVHIGIDDDVTASLTDPVLSIVRTNGSEEKYTLDDLGTLSGGDTIEVDLTNFSASDVQSATIKFVSNGEFSDAEAVAID